MFDAKYFKSQLPKDIDAVGGSPIVELLLVGGHTHRLRSVLEVDDGRITCEAYQMKGDLAHQRPRFGQTSVAPYEVFRVVMSCESIVAVVIDPSPSHPATRPGFF